MDSISLDIKKKGRNVLNYQNPKIVWKYCQEHGVSESDGILHFREMLKFMYACTVSKEPLTPSKALDEVWHTFIMFTRDYADFCKNVLGRFVHHNPDTDTTLETRQKNNHQYKAAYTICTEIFGDLPEFMWHNPRTLSSVANCGGCHGCDGDCYGCNGDGD